MTDEKHHLDLSKIEPVFRGTDPDDTDSRDTCQGADRVGTASPEVAGSAPAGGAFTETDEKAPPDPDDLDRLRR